MAKELNLKIIPKPKPKASFKSNVLVAVSTLLFLFCMAVFLAFSFFLNPSLRDKKDKLVKDLVLLDNPMNIDLKNELISVSDKIIDFDSLWKTHRISSNLFSFLQSICHKKVQIKSVNLGFNNQKSAVSFEARTDNFKTLGEQLISLKQDERIIVFNVGGISLSSEGVLFNVSMEVSNDIFLNKSN